MPAKLRAFLSRFVGVLAVFFLVRSGLLPQAEPADLAAKYPEIEGVYELALSGAGSIVLQVYFKDGTLRTVEANERESTKWEPVEGRELEFTTTSATKGAFTLDFFKDEQGRYTRFRAVNEKAKFDAAGVKVREIDDARADPASPSDRQAYFERHYRKSEQRIPMRDGVRLFTQVYSPIDRSEPHPIILFRTPYGIAPYGEAFRNTTFPSLLFAKENYILVCQDIRGAFMSEGGFEFMRPCKGNKRAAVDVDESSDAYDTVEWLLNNVPGHNGKVGVWGISYAGFTAAMAAVSAHPAVLAVSPQAPMGDLYLGDDAAHNGALYLAHYLNYLYTMGQPRKGPTTDSPPRLVYPTPDGYSYFLRLGSLANMTSGIMGSDNAPWKQAMAHETYDGYWKGLSIFPHLRDIRPAILTVGGWYDAEDLAGTLRTYRTVEKLNPGLRNTIVMGPWRHSGWSFFAGGGEDRGVFPFSGTVAYFQEKIELPFFNHFLKGQGPLDLPEAVVFETGTDQWRTYESWPPADAEERKLYCAGGGRLSFDEVPESSRDGFDEYLSDPAKPVPYTMQTCTGYNRDYFVEDQRFAAGRPDVLVYSGEPLAEDLTMTGPIRAELYVSTTGTDADWVVKLIDVYPDDAPDPKKNPGNIRLGGYQRLVRGDIMRGKFRKSFERPEPFVPGRVTKVEFELPDIQHTFLKGHRIMVQVQSSWFPLFDRNPQTFRDIRTAGDQDFRKATHRLHRGPRYPSGITFRMLGK